MDDEITLHLAPREVDLICTALSQRPWIEVNPLLQKIVSQAQQAQRQGAGPAPGESDAG